ncbi:hypothetical protein MMC17_006970 [Xylographa soralifera]|nr:hypothetical protein [Xylographa soralifera]
MSSDESDTNSYENPRLYEACVAGDLEAVKFELQSWQSRLDPSKLTPKHLQDVVLGAVRADQPLVASFLFDQGAVLDGYIVQNAMHGSLAMLQVFLDHGWDINERTDTGAPALKHLMGNDSKVEWFVNHGADPMVCGSHGESIITVAAANATPAAMDMLLADSLHAAVQSGKNKPGRIEMMQHLLDLGMDINEIEHRHYPPSRGWGQGTPLHTAVRWGNIKAITLLLERGAEQGVKNSSGQTPSDVAALDDDKGALEALNSL